jgi:hypothetical protein
MQEHRITTPVLALFAGTRGMVGFGLGLLLSERFRSDRRRAVGWTLLVAGALSTIPLALTIFRGRRPQARRSDERASTGVDRERERERERLAVMMTD